MSNYEIKLYLMLKEQGKVNSAKEILKNFWKNVK